MLLNPGWYNHDELLLRDGLRGPDATGLGVGLRHAFATTDALFYRPLGYTLFRLQMALGLGTPMPVHLLSVLHHAGNALLFGRLLRRLGQRPRAAFLLLLLPVAIPGVAWAAAAYERWLLTFGLLALLLIRARRPGPAILALPVGLLALLLKETAVVLGPLLLGAAGRRPGRLASAIVVLLGGLAFALWRTQVAPADPDYHGRSLPEALVNLLRMLAFPFAIGPADPVAVWGDRWLPGLAGLGLLLVLATAARPRVAWLAVGLMVLPLLPSALWSTPQGHYLYLTGPGLALLLDLALGARPRWRWLLVAWLVVHAAQVGRHYWLTGAALRELAAAHAAVPAGTAAVPLHVEPGAPGHVVPRYVVYLQKTGGRPLQRVERPLAGGLRLAADGTVHTVP